MKTIVTAQLVAEADRFALRFGCEDCAYFDADADGTACIHEYPNEMHRRSLLAPGSVLVFCKEFELGAP